MWVLSAGALRSLALMSLFGTMPLGCKRPGTLETASNLYLGPHYLPKAKNVIFPIWTEGVSQVTHFDPKLSVRQRENGEDPRKKLGRCPPSDDNVERLLKVLADFSQTENCGSRVSGSVPSYATLRRWYCFNRFHVFQLSRNNTMLIISCTRAVVCRTPKYGALDELCLVAKTKN